MPMHSMNGEGSGFSFDFPDSVVKPKAQKLSPKPEVIAKAADDAVDETLESLGELLGQPTINPDEVEWEELPVALPKQVQPDDGTFDPPSVEEITLEQ